VTDRYRFITAEAAHHAVALLCQVLDVSRSGDYGWRGRRERARTAADAALTTRIAAAHAASRGTYGSPRIHADLHAAGVSCGRRRVARLMRAAGLRGCRGHRRAIRTTIADRPLRPPQTGSSAPSPRRRSERPTGSG